MSFLERHKERISHWGDDESRTNDNFDHFKTGIWRDSHYREEVFVEAHTTRFKTTGLLAYSNNRHASNSSSDGESAVSVKDDSFR